MKAALILGTQLHRNHPAFKDDSVDAIILIEAQNLCAKLPYHKHKLIFMLSAMRHFAKYAEVKGKKVIYAKLEDTPDFLSAIREIIKSNGIDSVSYMEPADIKTSKSLLNFFKKLDVETNTYESQYFITPSAEREQWFAENPKGIMETFYRWQRKRTGLLMDGAKPVGSKWNYDDENRKPLPKKHDPIPEIPKISHDDITNDVIKVIDELYPNNPGSSKDFWLPVTHEDADKWLHTFITQRLCNFGVYEDAMKHDESFLYHSVLSPFINNGLLDPEVCVKSAIKAYEDGKAPLNSVEGFVRQIIGWREYMYGMYRNMPDFASHNFFGFNKELESWWYESNNPAHAQLPLPVRIALKNAHDHGYNHHIERLMVLGNWFLLNQYNPLSVYKWFSAMYVDAYEWVMVPNVVGMSQYADGGKIATKPYISGGNYLKKMGNWGNIDQKDLDKFTELYWEFLRSQKDKLKNNPRLAIMLKRV